ncbi:NAD(P)H-hydrate epimerase [Corynebacterium sp. 335C]
MPAPARRRRPQPDKATLRRAHVVFRAAQHRLGVSYARRVLVRAGHGDDGAAVLWAASYLASLGAHVDVLPLGEPDADALGEVLRCCGRIVDGPGGERYDLVVGPGLGASAPVAQ